MIFLKNSEQIELTKQAGVIVADTLSLLSSFVKPGVTGLQLDKLAEDYIRSNGGIPSCLGYHDYPNSICFSVNHQAVHCIPSSTPLKEGDVVKLDLVVNYKGWNADSAVTVIVPPAPEDTTKLAQAGFQALWKGLRQAKEGQMVSDISKAVFDVANAQNYGVVKEFVGHGIGRSIHESPQIPNNVIKEKNALLVAGMLICVEPIFTLSPDASIYYTPKDWNTWALSGKPVVHWEHTALIMPFPNPPEILTLRKDEVVPS